MISIGKRVLRGRHNLLLLFLSVALSLFLLIEFCKGFAGLWSLPTSAAPSVHLVLAARAHYDLEWTKGLNVSNLQVVPYIADDPYAEYHPPINKGNEAMMYLTYIYEFYDNLPDISIFTHGEDYAWHVDGVLEYSTAYAIKHLDLKEVVRRQYLSLRIDWESACPAWINTSITIDSPEFNPGMKEEEAFMKDAFEENFPNDAVPPILSQPCCSQFAVTKEAMRSVPRKQYKLHMDWLQGTELESGISGRIWEHLWQWSFLGKAVDCPSEHKALCRTYHICFESEEDWGKWKEHEASRKAFIDAKYDMLARGIQPDNEEVIKLDSRMKQYDDHLQPWKQRAIDRGKSLKQRIQIAGIYEEDIG